jgi:hypothetical protein
MPSQESINKTVKYFNPKGGCPGGCIEALFGVKDEEYERILAEALKGLNLREKALGKIGLDEDQLKEIPPVHFYGFHFKDGAHYRIGKDGRLRSSKYSTTWLFFSSTQVYMYQYILDMASTGIKENTEEYFYKDITNFSTTTETVSVRGKDMEDTEFTITVPNDKFFCAIGGVPDADKSISAMKQKLREKKG